MPLMRKLEILLSNQRSTPSQWRGVSNRWQAAVSCPEVPFSEEGFSRFPRRLSVEVLEGEADLIGARGLQVEAGKLLEDIALGRGEIVFVLEPDVTRFLQLRPGFLFGPAHLINGKRCSAVIFRAAAHAAMMLVYEHPSI